MSVLPTAANPRPRQRPRYSAVTPLDLEFLYYFSNASMYVLEAKINGLGEGVSPERVFHWLRYDRTLQQFHRLSFKSMGSDGGMEFRIFAQGALHFNESEARLELHGSDREEHELEVNDPNSVPEELAAQVRDFLRQESDA